MSEAHSMPARNDAPKNAAAMPAIGSGAAPEIADSLDKENLWARRQRMVVGALSMALLLVVWELIARYAIADPAILPAPSMVFSVTFQHITVPYPSQSSTLPGHILYSIVRILVGFVAGSVVGIAIGTVMSASKWVRYAIDPMIELMRPLPPLAFIPLLVVWFGIEELPKMVLIFIGVVPIMIIATLAGLDGVPKQLMDAAASLGASQRYAMIHVKIRAALVPIVTGMRVAVGVSWTSIVAAEMIAADHGIGYVILEAGNYLDTALVFSAIIIIGIVGLIMDQGLRLILKKLDPTK
jgi:NitT/TauT family transport system permease protein/taurine transport system permease protein